MQRSERYAVVKATRMTWLILKEIAGLRSKAPDSLADRCSSPQL